MTIFNALRRDYVKRSVRNKICVRNSVRLKRLHKMF